MRRRHSGTPSAGRSGVGAGELALARYIYAQTAEDGTMNSRMVVHTLAAVAVCAVAASSAQAASIREVFEKHALLGSWAAYCSKPMSRVNRYAIYRVIEGERVQREVKADP